MCTLNSDSIALFLTSKHILIFSLQSGWHLFLHYFLEKLFAVMCSPFIHLISLSNMFIPAFVEIFATFDIFHKMFCSSVHLAIKTMTCFFIFLLVYFEFILDFLSSSLFILCVRMIFDSVVMINDLMFIVLSSLPLDNF